MPNDHYAIVIGLSSYPKLGDPPPTDLRGPENDADSIIDWLTDPKGGGLPIANIKPIKSRQWKSPPDPAPTRDQIEEAFLWLDQLAQKNQQAGKGRQVGARLYLYASGHGFSPRFRQGCLLAGNAAERQFSANVFPTAWIDWLQDAEARECDRPSPEIDILLQQSSEGRSLVEEAWACSPSARGSGPLRLIVRCRSPQFPSGRKSCTDSPL